MLLISSWVPERWRGPFAEWCDEHQRGLATVPGLRRARRFELEDAPPGDVPDMLTMYELDDIELTRTDLWRERGVANGPIPEEILADLRSTRRDLELVAALPERWWPPRPSNQLDLFTLSDRRRVDRLVTSMDALSLEVALPLTMRLFDGTGGSPIVLLDHHDDDGDDAIDMLTDTSGANTSRWSVAFEIAGPDDRRTDSVSFAAP